MVAPSDLLLHAGRRPHEIDRMATPWRMWQRRGRETCSWCRAVGDGPYEGGWLDPLMGAVYPDEKQRRTPAPAVGCGTFKSKDSVLQRPDFDPAKPHTVAPGLFRFGRPESSLQDSKPKAGSPETTSREVIWWDPHVLHLRAETSFGLRRDDLIVRTRLFAVEAAAGLRSWRAGRERVLARASSGLRVRQPPRVREAARRHPTASWADAADIKVVARRGRIRPRGPRFGTLVPPSSRPCRSLPMRKSSSDRADAGQALRPRPAESRRPRSLCRLTRH